MTGVLASDGTDAPIPPEPEGRWRVSPRRVRTLAVAALLALAAIVVTGAAVRLTGSGLGCSDWPLCEQDQPVPALDFHAWVEFGNRLVTGLVSAAVIGAVLGATRRSPRWPVLVWLAWALVAGVVAQILVGAVTVLTHLSAPVVGVHFLLSMVLVAAATTLVVRAGEDPAGDGSPPAARAPRTDARGDLGIRFLAGWIWVVSVTGVVLTSAGPHRGDPDVQPIDVHIPTVARIHGASVVIFLVVVVALLVRERRRGEPTLVGALELVLGIAIAQAGIGYLQYFTDVPVLLVATHVAGATALFWAVTRLWAMRTAPVARVGSAGAATPEPVAG